MTWISVTKPTSSIWTSVNPAGKEQYDQASLSYDDSGTFYDGINPSQWTDVPKPVGSALIVAGMITGLVMPVTYSRSYEVNTWTKVLKPS